MCNTSKNATGGAREWRWVDCLNDFKFNPFRLHKRASHSKHRFFTLVQSRRTRLCTSFERVTGHNYIIVISIVSKFPHCLVTKSEAPIYSMSQQKSLGTTPIKKCTCKSHLQWSCTQLSTKLSQFTGMPLKQRKQIHKTKCACCIVKNPNWQEAIYKVHV